MWILKYTELKYMTKNNTNSLRLHIELVFQDLNTEKNITLSINLYSALNNQRKML